MHISKNITFGNTNELKYYRTHVYTIYIYIYIYIYNI